MKKMWEFYTRRWWPSIVLSLALALLLLVNRLWVGVSPLTYVFEVALLLSLCGLLFAGVMRFFQNRMAVGVGAILLFVFLTSGATIYFTFDLLNVFPTKSGLAQAIFGADHIEAVCRLARLGPLPDEAEITYQGGRHNMFAGTSYLAFSADNDAIEAWIAESPGLRNLDPESVSAHVPLEVILVTGNDCKECWDAYGECLLKKHHCLTVSPWLKNDWWPEVNQGRIYRVPQDSSANYGTVYIDDEHHRVWVKASHS